MLSGSESSSRGEKTGDDGEPAAAEAATGGSDSPGPNTPQALWADFRAALGALTIIGCPTDPVRGSIGRAGAFYPAAGLSIGLCVGVLDWVLRTFLSQEITSVLLVGTLALLSAGRQLDGFANTADGLIGFRGRERAIATMRDRRLGSSGAAAMFFLLVLKVRSLDLISGPIRGAGIVLPPLIGRWALVALAHRARGAGSTGEGALYDPTLTLRELVIASVFGVVVTLLLAESLGLLVLIVAALATAALRVYFDRRLGGGTVQSLDAGAEVLETLSVLLFALAS
jgi:adenosylcobinamide-GDP ribazoletransferase